MMLKADNISKFYGARQALDSVSFALEKGEVVGFLGPNGAGKSTAMRIITGFMDPTHGAVTVDGANPRIAKTREKIGYLPEANPLPAHMRVREYMRFRARLKGLRGIRAKRALAEMTERCHIGEFRDRMIGHLSKGMRQRVGLADSLLGNPELLVLDEPTSGLDPHQAAETRELISRLGGGVTVLLSSHILQDVERLCKRVVILNRGRLVADDTLKKIYDKHVEERTIRLDIISSEPVREIFRAVPGVRTIAVQPHPEQPDAIEVRLTIPSGVDLRQELSQVCSQRGWLITGMRTEPIRLEDIFRKLTGGRHS